MEIVKLSDICYPKQWKTIPTGNLLKEGYPVYGANGIIGYWKEYNHEQSVVAITCRGATCGNVNLTLPKAYVTGNAMCLENVKSDIDLEYLYFCLLQYDFKKVISGSAQPQITRQGLEKVNIKLVDCLKQKQIVTKLKKIISIIEFRKQQLQKLDELIQARFVELFGDPTINTKKYPLKLLPEIAEYWNGLTYKPDDVADKGTIVLRSSNIQNMTLDFEDIVRVNCKIGEKKYVHENDILMCSRNGSARLVGKVALIKNIEEPMSFGAFMLIIRSAYYPYLMTYFQMPAFRAQIVTGATTTINQITGRMLDNVKLPVPDMYVVNQFAAFVNQVNKSKLVIKNLLQIYKHQIQM